MSMQGNSERFCEMKGVGRGGKRENASMSPKKKESKYTYFRITSFACCTAIEWETIIQKNHPHHPESSTAHRQGTPKREERKFVIKPNIYRLTENALHGGRVDQQNKQKDPRHPLLPKSSTSHL